MFLEKLGTKKPLVKVHELNTRLWVLTEYFIKKYIHQPRAGAAVGHVARRPIPALAPCGPLLYFFLKEIAVLGVKYESLVRRVCNSAGWCCCRATLAAYVTEANSSISAVRPPMLFLVRANSHARGNILKFGAEGLQSCGLVLLSGDTEGKLQSAPAPSGVAAFMSAHSKTP